MQFSIGDTQAQNLSYQQHSVSYELQIPKSAKQVEKKRKTNVSPSGWQPR